MIDEVEEPKRNIKVSLASGVVRMFKAAEYFVSTNRTLVIGAQVSAERRKEIVERDGYIQAIATFNRDVWLSVEVEAQAE